MADEKDDEKSSGTRKRASFRALSDDHRRVVLKMVNDPPPCETEPALDAVLRSAAQAMVSEDEQEHSPPDQNDSPTPQ